MAADISNGLIIIIQSIWPSAVFENGIIKDKGMEACCQIRKSHVFCFTVRQLDISASWKDQNRRTLERVCRTAVFLPEHGGHADLMLPVECDSFCV